MTWPPVWRWRLTFPPPSTLRRLIQRPVARSNLKGLNQTRSPCGTQGSSSLWTAISGNPIAAMTCSVRSSVKALSSLSPARSVALYHARFNSAGRLGEAASCRLELVGVDEPDPGSVLASRLLILGANRGRLEGALDIRRFVEERARLGISRRVREVERGGAADVRRGHGGTRPQRDAALVPRREDIYSGCPEIDAVAVVAPA